MVSEASKAACVAKKWGVDTDIVATICDRDSGHRQHLPVASARSRDARFILVGKCLPKLFDADRYWSKPKQSDIGGRYRQRHQGRRKAQSDKAHNAEKLASDYLPAPKPRIREESGQKK